MYADYSLNVSQTLAKRNLRCKTEHFHEECSEQFDDESSYYEIIIDASSEEIAIENSIKTPIELIDKFKDILKIINKKKLWTNMDLGQSTINYYLDQCENWDVTSENFEEGDYAGQHI